MISAIEIQKAKQTKVIIRFPLILYCFSIIVPDIDDVMSKKRNSIVKSSGEGEKERSRVLPWKFTPFPTFVARAALLYSSYRNCSKVETRGQWMMAPGSRVAKTQTLFRLQFRPASNFVSSMESTSKILIPSLFS